MDALVGGREQAKHEGLGAAQAVARPCWPPVSATGALGGRRLGKWSPQGGAGRICAALGQSGLEPYLDDSVRAAPGSVLV